MHGLDIIIRRNVQASAREAAHALLDCDSDVAGRIADATQDAWVAERDTSTYIRALKRALQEG